MLRDMNATELLEPDVRADGAPPCPYEPLIGSWDVQSRWFAPDGTIREADGEWHFSWILGGWGVQDVLFIKGATASERGTSVRCYDQTAQVWRVVWFMPKGDEFVALRATDHAGEIVQEGDSLREEPRQRWTISEITKTSFLWRGESSIDGGITWRLDQEMQATRQ
jgi:hypothetical protein